MAKRLLRKTLSAPGLLREVRACFDALNDPVPSRGLSLAECLMSGLAVFGLKYPSLLQFDRDARTDEVVRANLRSLYGIERAPSDTALRERLDEVDPRQLRDVGAARARWRIENETFNTLKNQGYCFEHNFDHGKKHLATVFASLMMLAFLLDQTQQRCCALFMTFPLADWETLYQAIAFGYPRAPPLHAPQAQPPASSSPTLS